MPLLNEEIVNRLSEIAQNSPPRFQHHETALDGMLTLYLEREDLPELVQTLRDDEKLRFIFLTTLCGIHYPENPPESEMCVMVQMHALESNTRIRLKTFFPAHDAVVPTLTGLFPTTGWMEREAFDFYGIQFNGHPDLRRILNVEDMDYYPMLKQHPLEDQTRHDKNDVMFGRS